ncbi:hypothetical protein Pmar_PMAR016577 [Perkinsus marinus ATCC 50983]|uniref:F-box domain-containing protein n=1 Tax=Perkinsus marinus (strain ATCC 50983 / TXsc) TaxID=423536 RepID=C5KTJ7_PERM5|nr:hypothetical protein Pmar_PMAR016577 [Perkinsus marinus ATCC 50983]EER12176.1 hypothetical protein Pmar_PMAR016577 [Perkinsus marinus ATCC 50983]|eukprot:XP_002780381.1 hypothetical protein Pmar_PMAR016577 [Perkinsus marinus ATCC 50983]
MDTCCGSSNGGMSGSSGGGTTEGSSEGDGCSGCNSSRKEGIRRSAKDLLTRYLDRLIVPLVRNGMIRSTVLTALESALDSGQVDSLLVLKTARDAGVPSVDVPPLHGVGPLDDSNALLPMGPLIRIVRFLDPVDAASLARTSRLHADIVRHPATVGGLLVSPHLPRPSLRAVQHLLRHNPPRVGVDTLIQRWLGGHLEGLDVDFTATIRNGRVDSRSKRVMDRLSSIADSLDTDIRVVRFAKCSDVGQDFVPIIRTLQNTKAMTAVTSLTLVGLILEPSPQRSIRLPQRMDNLRRLELTQITVVRGCGLLPSNGTVIAPHLTQLVLAIRPESAALEVVEALIGRGGGGCILEELRVHNLKTPTAVNALAATLSSTISSHLKYLEVGPWTDDFLARVVPTCTALEELSGLDAPSVASPVLIELGIGRLTKLRVLHISVTDEDSLRAVARGIRSSRALLTEISVQYFGPDSLEATLALVRLRIACPQVTTVTFPRANFMRSSPSTAEHHHISAGDTCFMGVAEQKLAEELRPRLICNCALCLLHDDSDSNLDHFHRNVHELWSLLTAAEQSAYETIAAGD